ncbi:MAG: cobyric acid synthase [Acidimicrobiales bacterium]
MVCGTTSDAGKSTLVAGLCRSLARRGVSVAPFKAQNMALNSAVTPSGHEIGRAQAFQALAAGVEPEVAMNPVLLKPTGDRTSQVVVMGRPTAELDAAAYHDHKATLLPLVLDALADLRRRFDVVVLEGAGSPTEINLLDRDIVNLRIAHEAALPAVVVGDINLGGVFASLYGTVALLPDHLRATVKGLVINKLRGDPALLLDGCDRLAELTGVPVLGVVPWLDTTGLDAEDSMALDRAGGPHPGPVAEDGDVLDVAVVRLPRISNFTDLDPLGHEPGVSVRYVSDAAGLGRPDLIVVPGSKSTVSDLAWLRRRGLAERIATSDATVLGICAGYQMLGWSIDDRVESGAGSVAGLGLLPVTTTFAPDKVTRQRVGTADGRSVHGYQIHHGRVRPDGGDPWIDLGGEIDGIRVDGVHGTTLHGLFEADGFRRAVLAEVAARAGKRFVPSTTSFEAVRQERIDALADALEAHLDMGAIDALVRSAG